MAGRIPYILEGVADAKAPVAIRIVRPYGSPEEFVRNDLETLTKTSITLGGAQPRPKGVVLRFEVTLAGGRPVMRGEGRVLSYNEATGLTLRFTRLDPKSKAIVDWVAAIKEARASGLPDPPQPELPSGKLPGERPSERDLAKGLPPPPPPKNPSAPPKSISGLPPARASAPPRARGSTSPRAASAPPPQLALEAAPASDPAPSEPMSSVPSTQAPSGSSLDDAPTATSLPESSPFPAASSLEDLPTVATTRDMPELPELAGLSPTEMRKAVRLAAKVGTHAAAKTVETPENRTELLDRLRERARAMPHEKVERILEKRAR
jgi:hypothetical protein